jgi:hypothetical protein
MVASLAVAGAALPYSLTISYAGILAFLAAWLWEGRWAEKRQLLEQHPLVWLLPAFFLLHLVGLWHTDNLKMGWAAIDDKLFLLLVPVALASTRPFNKWEINTLFGAFLVSLLTGTIICGISALTRFINNSPVPGFASQTSGLDFWLHFSHTRLASAIGLNPTYFALYLALCLLILIYVYRDNADELMRSERMVLYGIFSFFSLFIVLLGSQLLTIATLIIVVFAATRFINLASRRFSIFVVSGVAVFISVCAFVHPVTRINSIEAVFSPSVTAPAAKNPETVLRIPPTVLGHTFFRRINPLFGGGTGDVADLIREVERSGQTLNEGEGFTLSGQFVHTLLALGAVGLATLLAVLLVPVYFAYRRKYFLFSAFVSLFLLTCLTEPVLEVQQGILFFALFNSLFLFQQKGLQQAAGDELIFA